MNWLEIELLEQSIGDAKYREIKWSFISAFTCVRPFFARVAPPLGGDGMQKKDTEIPPERAFI
jgi:hypothetical protein